MDDDGNVRVAADCMDEVVAPFSIAVAVAGGHDDREVLIGYFRAGCGG